MCNTGRIQNNQACKMLQSTCIQGLKKPSKLDYFVITIEVRISDAHVMQASLEPLECSISVQCGLIAFILHISEEGESNPCVDHLVKSKVQDTKKQNKGRVKQHDQGNVYMFVDSPGYC